MQVDVDCALVCPWLAALQVMKGNGVVGRLHIGGEDIAVGGHLDESAGSTTAAVPSVDGGSTSGKIGLAWDGT